MDIQHLHTAHSEHWQNACAIRVLAMDAVQRANSGHPGMPMGMADVATVLYSRHLKFYAQQPDWPDRDRFVLSAGHGSMLLYALLYLTGHAEFDLDQLKNFRQLGARTAGHPEHEGGDGIETTTGPLGQGLANAVGLAIAEANLRAQFGADLVDHRTYVLVGDGCLMEGLSQEAISLAGRLGLNRLTVLWDDNRVTIDGPLDLSDATDQRQRFAACGWRTLTCDGHDPVAIDAALADAKTSDRPTFIACRTHIGFGSPNKEGLSAAHGSPLGEDEIALTRERYGWSHPPFEIPGDILRSWRNVGQAGRSVYESWQKRLTTAAARRRRELERRLAGTIPGKVPTAIRSIKRQAATERPAMATRKASETVLKAINPLMPELVGGSADLTGSNNTLTADLGIFDRGNEQGRYLYYGIREHAMVAAMNGMALHGAIRPYGGTFLCFADYARPSLRLAALMKQPIINVMTHDSIGLGEDGPTHQPVEHLAMLRATPNLRVFRPCDLAETAEAWQVALESNATPSVLALTRQSLPTLRVNYQRANRVQRGAYTLANFAGPRKVILLASGSEVAIAMDARRELAAQGIGTRVVSMPCWELFAEQPESYRCQVLPAGPVRIAIEAGIGQGWERWTIGERGREKKAGFVGMTGFGASAPASDLYGHFGITVEAVVQKALDLCAL